MSVGIKENYIYYLNQREWREKGGEILEMLIKIRKVD